MTASFVFIRTDVRKLLDYGNSLGKFEKTMEKRLIF